MAQQGAKGSRTRVGLAASLLIHLTLVWAAILSLPRTGPPPEPPSFVVDLIPQFRPPIPRAKPRAPATASSAPVAPAAHVQTQQAPSSLAVPAPAPAPTGEDQGQSAVRALLRGSVGCSEATFMHLTQDEQDRCAKWRRAHVDPNFALPPDIAPEKQAWYEASLRRRAIGEVMPPRPKTPSLLVGKCGGATPLPEAVKIGPCQVGIPGIFNSDDVAPP